MTRKFDLAIIGSGPAGAEAALSAAAQGLSVVVLDESEDVGGQVYRAPPAALRQGLNAKAGSEAAAGEDLRQRFAASGVTHAMSRRVWLAGPGFELRSAGAHGDESWSARAVCVAAGTHERIYPFPGWTTPGVIGLAAATILLKSQHMLPGRRPVVAGSGPLLLAVANAIIEAGGDVAALVDTRSAFDWARTLPGALTRTDLLQRGVGWLRNIRKASVPIYRGSAIAAVNGSSSIERVEISPIGQGGSNSDRTIIKTDSLCIGYGLIPAIETLRILGADVVYDEDLGGWVPTIDAHGRASVANVFAAGDGTGIRGAAAASAGGTVAGLTAAHDLGALSGAEFEQKVREPMQAYEKAKRFGRGMAGLMAAQPELMRFAEEDTLVCRCEEVTRGEIEAALAGGAHDVNQVKSWTRCGMGPCQGRFCGEGAATLVAAAVGGREKAGIWTARVPLRPVAIEDLVGEFDYADIPKPAPAPA